MQQNQEEHEKIYELQMKALKDGKNLTPAQLIQQLNVTPAKGTEKGGKGAGKTSKGKSKGKDDKGGGNAGQDQSTWKGAAVCWHHNAKHHYPDWGVFLPSED